MTKSLAAFLAAVGIGSIFVSGMVTAFVVSSHLAITDPSSPATISVEALRTALLCE